MNAPWGNKKFYYEATEWRKWLESFSGSQDIFTISSSHCSVVRFKEECPHRIDCLLGRKPGGGTRVEEKPIRDTACRLRGKGLDMPCDSCWGWLSWFSRSLSHFVSFKNRNHWPQFESCLISSSDHGAICFKLDLVESEKVFSMKVIHAESPFPCDYVISRNGYCKCVMTSTAENKSVLKITNYTKNEHERPM